MAARIRIGSALTRRRFIAGAGAAASLTLARPAVSLASSRPLVTHGVQSGDVSLDSGVIWARTDRPARMLLELSTSESFRTIRGGVAIDALPETDFTAKALVEDLPPGQDIFYRVRFQDLASPAIVGEVRTGRFRTAPSERRSISFAWSGDTCGQGWGIDEARGGMTGYAIMQRNRPDFFIHCGDRIYADGPIPSQQSMPDGQIWRNLVTEDKAKGAETLAEFRGNYKYNLLDRNLLAFNAEVPLLALWDDHEVIDNWYPGQLRPLSDGGVLSDSLLAARGLKAFREYTPMLENAAESGRIYRKVGYGPMLDVFLLDMRSYRGPNDRQHDPAEGPQTQLLGAAQIAWLKRELIASRATWKVIAADLPIGLVSDDAVAQGDGPPLGREFEMAGLLAFIKHAAVHNVVWLTADMHYTAAHHYDPNRAVFQDFAPFWEFVSGPLHAGTWSPSPLDNTFGPRVMFQKGCTPEQGDNLPPCFGLQFFGHVAIDGSTEVMTVTLRDILDRDLWSVRIEPQRARWSRAPADAEFLARFR